MKKEHGGIIAFVGLIFLARGFVDLGNSITDIYDGVFIHYDIPIAIIAFVLLAFVIVRILLLSRRSGNEAKVQHSINEGNFSPENIHKVHHSPKHQDFDYSIKKEPIRMKNKKIVEEPKNTPQNNPNVKFDNKVEVEKSPKGINKSSANIHFESNDLLDEYKK